GGLGERAGGRAPGAAPRAPPPAAPAPRRPPPRRAPPRPPPPPPRGPAMTAAILLPIVDVAAGVLATVLPSFTAPAFLRLGRPAGPFPDRPTTAFLPPPSPQLRPC